MKNSLQLHRTRSLIVCALVVASPVSALAASKGAKPEKAMVVKERRLPTFDPNEVAGQQSVKKDWSELKASPAVAAAVKTAIQQGTRRPLFRPSIQPRVTTTQISIDEGKPNYEANFEQGELTLPGRTKAPGAVTVHAFDKNGELVSNTRLTDNRPGTKAGHVEILKNVAKRVFWWGGDNIEIQHTQLSNKPVTTVQVHHEHDAKPSKPVSAPLPLSFKRAIFRVR